MYPIHNLHAYNKYKLYFCNVLAKNSATFVINRILCIKT